MMKQRKKIPAEPWNYGDLVRNHHQLVAETYSG